MLVKIFPRNIFDHISTPRLADHSNPRFSIFLLRSFKPRSVIWIGRSEEDAHEVISGIGLRCTKKLVVESHSIAFHPVLSFVTLEPELRYGLVRGLRRWRLSLKQHHWIVGSFTKMVGNTRTGDAATDDCVTIHDVLRSELNPIHLFSGFVAKVGSVVKLGRPHKSVCVRAAFSKKIAVALQKSG